VEKFQVELSVIKYLLGSPSTSWEAQIPPGTPKIRPVPEIAMEVERDLTAIETCKFHPYLLPYLLVCVVTCLMRLLEMPYFHIALFCAIIGVAKADLNFTCFETGGTTLVTPSDGSYNSDRIVYNTKVNRMPAAMVYVQTGRP
jgi:hypothetical protein